jgi:hypothetical protein
LAVGALAPALGFSIGSSPVAPGKLPQGSTDPWREKGTTMDDLGAKFWLGLIGLTIAIGLAVGLTLLLIGAVWYAWGLFGVFLAILLVFGGVGYIMDRRERTRRESLAG